MMAEKKKSVKKSRLSIAEIAELIEENRPCGGCHPVGADCSTCVFDFHLTNNYWDESVERTERPVV